MDVRAEVHAKVKKFQLDHNEPSYKTALDLVLGADAELKERYAESSQYVEATDEDRAKRAAGETLVTMAKQHMARKGGTFSEALHALVPAVPGELKAYLRLDPADIALNPIPGLSTPPLLARGIGKATEIFFAENVGWTMQGAADWILSQGLSGGTMTRTPGGFTWIPEKFVNAFPR